MQHFRISPLDSAAHAIHSHPQVPLARCHSERVPTFSLTSADANSQKSGMAQLPGGGSSFRVFPHTLAGFCTRGAFVCPFFVGQEGPLRRGRKLNSPSGFRAVSGWERVPPECLWHNFIVACGAAVPRRATLDAVRHENEHALEGKRPRPRAAPW